MNTSNLTFDQLPAAMGELFNAVGDIKSLLQQRQEPAQPALDEVLDVDGVAELTKMAPKTVSEKAASGDIPHYKPAKKLIFFRSEVIEWMKSARRKTNAQIAEDVENSLTAAA